MMKTRAEIIEETQKFLEQIDPQIFAELQKYITAIDFVAMDALSEQDKSKLMRGAPSATVGYLIGLMRLCTLAKSCAHGHFDEQERDEK